MTQKRIFDAILLSLTIAYAITKAISGFQCSGSIEPIEDSRNDYCAEN